MATKIIALVVMAAIMILFGYLSFVYVEQDISDKIFQTAAVFFIALSIDLVWLFLL